MSRALLIVDAQNDYLTGGPLALHEPEEAARVGGLVVEAFRDSAEPIVHLRRATGAEISDAVAPEGAEPVIEHAAQNAFDGTDLEAQLRASGASELIVIGMCVDETVRAAASLGFSVAVVDDATTAPDAPIDGIDAATYDEFLTSLSASARIVASHELI